MSQMGSDTLLQAFRVPDLDYSNALLTGSLQVSRWNIIFPLEFPWNASPEILSTQSAPRTRLRGDSGSGRQIGPGLVISGPRDVFLKHCVNPNEFQVPTCPSPILLSCKNVGLSFFHNYCKSLCPVAFSSGCGIYIFPGQIQNIRPVPGFRSRLKWLA